MAEEPQKEKPQRWYDSEFFGYIWEGIGTAVVILAVAVGLGVAIRGCSSSHGYILQKEDLNKNGKPESFYEIGGIKYFSEIDGKNLEASLRE